MGSRLRLTNDRRSDFSKCLRSICLAVSHVISPAKRAVTDNRLAIYCTEDFYIFPTHLQCKTENVTQYVTSYLLLMRQCKSDHRRYICDRISYNKASTHTKSNLRFYQKWIAGLIHYHISHCTSFSTGKSGFCSSFLPTLSKPRV